ncbi:hypothetical protein IW140_004499 [Coemansia sp. RSA 1813]|nr:hypothetical protein LPJ74_002550 [Coemansia sp. RSA 1843]KAJ2087815.1 hypothetical protein IW138_004710 [Coemansia sp. RSA 986]KAJ2567366.1 hypothetical protein IW140_004499 [Coemansia sp. RSA 1813]
MPSEDVEGNEAPVVEEAGDPAPASTDPVAPPRKTAFVVAAWLVFLMTLASTCIIGVYVCTWLGEFSYNAQIAKHVCCLFWALCVAWCFQPGNRWVWHFKFPDSNPVTFFCIGILYIVMMCFLFSDSVLEALYKNQYGNDIEIQGTRKTPNISGHTAFLVVTIFNAFTGGIGVAFLVFAFLV